MELIDQRPNDRKDSSGDPNSSTNSISATNFLSDVKDVNEKIIKVLPAYMSIKRDGQLFHNIALEGLCFLPICSYHDKQHNTDYTAMTGL